MLARAAPIGGDLSLAGGGPGVVGRPGGGGLADEGVGEFGDATLVVPVSGDVRLVSFAFLQVGAGEPVGLG